MPENGNDIRIKPLPRRDRESTRTATRSRGTKRVLGRPADHTPRETRSFYETTEFVIAACLAVVVLVVGFAGDNDSLNNFRVWILITAVGAAYMVSRGLAKEGDADRK